MAEPPPSSVTTLRAAVESIAAEAGQMALARFGTDFHRWEKTPGSPVCEVDIDIDQMLKARWSALLPDAGWLSEETADNPARLARDRLWVVDPIDGTRDYIRARPGWCVSIALVERGRVVIGVLDAPARGEIWSAALGEGATLNGAALQAGSRTDFPGSRVPSIGSTTQSRSRASRAGLSAVSSDSQPASGNSADNRAFNSRSISISTSHTGLPGVFSQRLKSVPNRASAI